MRFRPAAALLAVTLGLASIVSAADAPTVKLTQKENHVAVEVGGTLFTNYYFAAEGGRPYVRPFMYPVLAADGVEVTSDQMQVATGDHPHHRSLWVAQGKVNGADHWTLGKKPRDPEALAAQPKQRHLKFVKIEGDAIVQELAWEDAAGQPMLNETRTVRFLVLADGARGVDITSVFEPIGEPVTFGDTKEAGLCSVRVPKALSDTSVITQGGGVVSKGLKTEKDVWGKKAPWCDLSGTIDGKPYGVAVLDHPTNPRHPSNWHVRHYGLLSANVFGLHDFDKANPEGAGDMKLEKGKATTFRYRVIIHAGDAAAAKLDEKFKDFVDTAPLAAP